MLRALLTVGLGFGDEGKGSIVDYLTRKYEAKLVVRYCGGAQAAHRVEMPDGRTHVFSQIGSGTFAGADTFLSKYMLVNPLSFNNEMDSLRLKLGQLQIPRVFVDEAAVITTPYHQIANRIREQSRGANAHGSCGMGIGETVALALESPEYALRVEDLTHTDVYFDKLHRIKSRYAKEFPDEALFQDVGDFWKSMVEGFRRFRQRPEVYIVDSSFLRDSYFETVVFEGSQGVLLDEWYGFHPHTTWSTTTLENADKLLREAKFAGPAHRLGIIRAYSTRHGPGPFPTESSYLTKTLPDPENKPGGLQGNFRVGWFDMAMLKYAMQMPTVKVDSIALTCLDRLGDGASSTPINVCQRYTHLEHSRFDEIIHERFSHSRKPYDKDLDEQAEMTKALMYAKPEYKSIQLRQLSDEIVYQTHRSVSVVSYGPTWKDKQGSTEFLKSKRDVTGYVEEHKVEVTYA